ncbi:MAG: AAA family ATPase, partial [Candidatus Eremiobacteraeota bacterium]|nr:AAA family ATPase [Candidatus Eremiobacteraeota bacterium]
MDLFGFKTFADRTRLEFQPGISGIVGPNGSGKSNFVDAVRWVLGEQSARQLRGARMDDVIFAGNSQRRSMGMAEVTLTFDNSDGAVPSTFSELAITRRVYRSGESEFFLNRTQVRLRDITDLLLGTGLAAELAAIVSQGEIDAILSAKPEQRRELFEGVAGTSRYRMRKREAQRRLEQTAANALRVNDLLAELEKQIPAIEQQVRRAKRYQKAGQQLRDLEVLSFLRKTSARREERSAIQSQLGEDESAAKSSASKDAQLQTDLNKARYEEYQASLALDERNAAHAKVAAALAEHASAQAAAQAKMLELSRHSETLEHEVDAAALAESDADRRLSSTSEDLRSSRSLRDDALAASEAAAAAESSATANWEAAYAVLRAVEDKRTRAAAALAEGTSAINAASAQWQRSLDAAKRIDHEIAEATHSVSAARQRREEAVAAREAAAAEHARVRALCESLERESAAMDGARDAAQTTRDETYTKVVQREAKRATLSQVGGDGGLGSAGAQLLFEAKKSGAATGIMGLIAQHVQAAPEHRVAIDA